MSGELEIRLSQEQRELWERVVELWALAQERNEEAIAAALHPLYVGWDLSARTPHDREAAVLSVSGQSPQIAAYSLQPHSVQVYDHCVGIVHYSYDATVIPQNAPPMEISGKWTEVYLKQGSKWVMISVSGRPDTPSQQSAD